MSLSVSKAENCIQVLNVMNEHAWFVRRLIYVILFLGQVKRMRRLNNHLICGSRLAFGENLGSISFTVIEMCDSLTNCCVQRSEINASAAVSYKIYMQAILIISQCWRRYG